MRVNAVLKKKSRREAGFTLIELIITLVIISLLTLGTVPVARNLMRKQREKELKKNLQELRQAIDAFHIVCNKPPGLSPFETKKDATCYPPDLETLEKGVQLANTQKETVRFLRRIPVAFDPITGREGEWMKRSVNQERGDSWDEKSVFDVYIGSQERALDGTYYKDW